MSNGLKMLLIAASAIITCIICVVSFRIAVYGERSSITSANQFRELIQYEELKDYDQKLISGSEVIDLIHCYEKEELYMLVKTKECIASKGVYYNRTESMEIAGTYNKELERVSEDYINEQAGFECSVDQNQNGIVIGLSFNQR